MANSTSALPGKRRELKKSQAITVMVIGAILFAQALFISAEVGTTAHWTKNLIALIGIVILIVGLYLRPVKPTPENK